MACKWSLGALALLFALALNPVTASAVVINNYGDLPGTNVVYTDIVERVLNPSEPTLFGSPSVSGNSLDFDPIAHPYAVVATGGDADFADAGLGFGIMANPGFFIDSIHYSEKGGYSLFDSAESMAQIAGLTVRVMAIDGTATAIDLPVVPINFSLSQAAGAGLDVGTWDAGFSVNVATMLQSMGYAGRATKVEISFDNVLAANAVSEKSFASIDKKDAIMSVGTQPVPEPATLALIGIFGAVGTVIAVRRGGAKA